MEQSRTGNGTGKLIGALLSLALVFGGEVAGLLIGMFVGADEDLSATLGGAIAAVAAFVALGGKDYLRFDGKAILESWKFMWWIVALSGILAAWDFWDYVSAGESFHPGWFMRCVSSLILCLAIGANEEGMFRGLLFGGLLARLGERKNGIWWAVIVSSLAFGCAHVSLEDFDPNNLLTFAQGFLKIVQTGIYAVMLCAVMLKTKNIVGAMLVHAIDDWLLFVVAIGFFGEPLETEYVTADTDEAISTIIFYLIIIALYLPTFIKALREIAKIQAPQFGPFFKEEPLCVPAGAAGYLQEPYPQQTFVPQPPYQDQGTYAQQYAQNQQAYRQQPLSQPYAQQPGQRPYAQQPYVQQPGQQPYAQQPQQVVYYPVPTPAEPLMPTSTMGDASSRYGQLPAQAPQQAYAAPQSQAAQQVPAQAPEQPYASQPYAPAQQVPQQAPVQQPPMQQYPPVQKYPQQPSSGRPPAPDGLR